MHLDYRSHIMYDRRYDNGKYESIRIDYLPQKKVEWALNFSPYSHLTHIIYETPVLVLSSSTTKSDNNLFNLSYASTRQLVTHLQISCLDFNTTLLIDHQNIGAKYELQSKILQIDSSVQLLANRVNVHSSAQFGVNNKIGYDFAIDNLPFVWLHKSIEGNYQFYR